MSVPSRIQEGGVDSLSIIPDAQSKNADAVGDLRFDCLGMCVPEGILQRLARDTIDVVAKDWMQFPRHSFNGETKRRRTSSAIAGPREFFP